MNEKYMVVSVKDLSVLLKKARVSAKKAYPSNPAMQKVHCVILKLDIAQDIEDNTQVQIPSDYTHGATAL